VILARQHFMPLWRSPTADLPLLATPVCSACPKLARRGKWRAKNFGAVGQRQVTL
jgi:hypothetical protein